MEQAKAAPAATPPMQRTEKQRNDVAKLLSMARETEPGFGVEGGPDVRLAGPGAEFEEGEPEGDAAAEGAPKPLADDETDPAAEAALAAASGGNAPPEASQAPPRASKPMVGVPDWFVMPDGFYENDIPDGATFCCMRFEARLTYRPKLGDRQCLLMPLTVKDELLAYKRIASLGTQSSQAVVSELAKQMIKLIDGKKPEWVRRAARNYPDVFWNDIGGDYRRMIESWYVKTHVLAGEDRARFLADCMAVRTKG